MTHRVSSQKMNLVRTIKNIIIHLILLHNIFIDKDCNVFCQQYQIQRSQQGDFLHGDDIDCSLHNAVRVDTTRCFCNLRGSYYTNRNNVTGCFEGPGTEELGCRIYIEEHNALTTRDILTLKADSQKSEKMTMASSTNCVPSFQSVQYWANDTWLDISVSEISKYFISQRLHSPETKTALLFIISTDEARNDFMKGKLIRFNYNLCSSPSCLMFKFEGNEEWIPHIISTTPPPTTTSTLTTTPPPTTTSTSTTTPPSTTTPEITTDASTTTSTKAPTTAKPTTTTDTKAANVGSHSPSSGQKLNTRELIAILVIAGIIFLIAVIAFFYYMRKLYKDQGIADFGMAAEDEDGVKGTIVYHNENIYQQGPMSSGRHVGSIDITDQAEKYFNVRKPWDR